MPARRLECRRLAPPDSVDMEGVLAGRGLVKRDGDDHAIGRLRQRRAADGLVLRGPQFGFRLFSAAGALLILTLRGDARAAEAGRGDKRNQERMNLAHLRKPPSHPLDP